MCLITVWPEVKGRISPLDAENPTILSPPQCQISHTFWSKNPTFLGIFFENKTDRVGKLNFTIMQPLLVTSFVVSYRREIQKSKH